MDMYVVIQFVPHAVISTAQTWTEPGKVKMIIMWGATNYENIALFLKSHAGGDNTQVACTTGEKSLKSPM